MFVLKSQYLLSFIYICLPFGTHPDVQTFHEESKFLKNKLNSSSVTEI